MEAQTYFRDESDSDITGIVIVETDGSDIRVTENRDTNWCAPYWMKGTEFNIKVMSMAEGNV